jgi:hypothetical protein
VSLSIVKPPSIPALLLEARAASLDFFPDLLALDFTLPERWLRADPALFDEEEERLLADDTTLLADDIELIEPRVPTEVPDLLSFPEFVALE